jgi:type IV secretion system protein VirB1
MEPLILATLLTQCAPLVHPETAAALVVTESSANPHAIGVVGGSLLRQPRTRAEAFATAASLEATGWDFSVGLAQINRRNFTSLGLTLEEAFDPCANLAAMQTLLVDCYRRSGRTSRRPTAQEPSTAAIATDASTTSSLPSDAATSSTNATNATGQAALRRALSCYYSGNFVTGIRHGYVARVVRSSLTLAARPP